MHISLIFVLPSHFEMTVLQFGVTARLIMVYWLIRGCEVGSWYNLAFH